MATMTKTQQNGTAKKENSTAKKSVQKKLTKQTTGETSKAQQPKIAPVIKQEQPKPVINLDARIHQFEKLRGLANKREQLVQTLSEITRFNYNTGDATFSLNDASGMSFSTGNTNLIKLVTSQLQQTLETRKNELEAEIIAFEL